MNIESVNLHMLRNEEHFEFHTEFRALAVKYKLDTFTQNVLNTYLTHYHQLDAALEQIRNSLVTDQLVAADHKRDQTFSGFHSQVEGNLYNPDPAKREAAQRIDNIFAHYGNLAARSRDEETAALYNFTKDLSVFAVLADVELLGLKPWLTALEADNNAYKALADARYTEKTAKPPFSVKQARKSLDTDYHSLCKYMEVYVNNVTPNDPNLSGLITNLNPRIAHYRELINRRAAARANKAKDNNSGDSPPPSPTVVTSNTGSA